MNSHLQSLFSLYQGSGRKSSNSNCDVLLSILQEPVPTKPIILDFSHLNTHSPMIELCLNTQYDAKCRKFFAFVYFYTK